MLLSADDYGGYPRIWPGVHHSFFSFLSVEKKYLCPNSKLCALETGPFQLLFQPKDLDIT